jgi:YWFCY protein
MAANTENEQALQKIIDFIRLLSIVVMLVHFYFYCYGVWERAGYTFEIADRIVLSLSATGLFDEILISKLFALGLLAISLIGARGKKDGMINPRTALYYIVCGLTLFLPSHFIFKIGIGAYAKAGIYVAITSLGYILILTGGTLLSRLLHLTLKDDIFNKLNESFPQEERLFENEFSINLPAAYILKGKRRASWINIINPFRSSLVIGTPGAGKSYFVIRHVITQHIRKGFTMFIYDFKYDDLSRITYNTLRNNYHRYPKKPKFYVINFEDLSRSHRCNPLDPSTMEDITDATESSRTIMLGLNRDWIKK